MATAGVLTVSGGLDISAQAGGTGTLAFDLDTLAGTNDKIVAGSVAIGTGVLGLNDFVFTNVGGLQAGTYKLITSGAPVNGTLDAGNLTGSIGAFSTTLQITGNDIELVVNSDPYTTWSGGAAFGIDSNGDGVSNGLAWLLGAADKDVNATALLPTVTESNGDLIMTFNMLNAASRGTATLKLQHSNDLGGADPWTAVTVPEVSGGPVSGVTFTVTAGSPLNTVVATISASEAAAGKVFGRLLAESP